MARIILATIGSLGDLHPFIAIGKELAARGDQVLMAVPEDGLQKVRAAGLEAASILPSYASICDRLGMKEEDVAARILSDTSFVVDEILMPSLHSSTAALDKLSVGADVIASSIFAFAADIVAEKHRLPLATIVLQPMTLFSAWQPPTAPRFELMRHHPRTSFDRSWNRTFLSLVRTMLRHRHGKLIDTVRAEHGLAPAKGAPMLDHGSATAAVLCCWSSVLGTLPPDAPGNAELVGFPFFDSESGGEEALAPELEAFLQNGDAPLVFTLGSFAVASPGRFYEEAIAVSQALSKRAVMLTGQPGAPRLEGNRLFMGYAPHSAVFPHAAIVIHHGGIGTTGQALRAGRPQLVVPHFGDQFDNAVRVQSAGLGTKFGREQFESTRAKDVISRMLSDAEMADAAASAAEKIASENGAAEAARRIASLSV